MDDMQNAYLSKSCIHLLMMGQESAGLLRVTGMVIAAMAMLVANRILPADMASKDDWKKSAFWDAWLLAWHMPAGAAQPWPRQASILAGGSHNRMTVIFDFGLTLGEGSVDVLLKKLEVDPQCFRHVSIARLIALRKLAKGE
jgi:hypothetical protein